MQLLFTTLPSKKTAIREIPEEEADTDILLQRQLQLQQKNTLFKAPDTFSNHTYFSKTTMFSRVQSGTTGCSSCGLQKGKTNT